MQDQMKAAIAYVADAPKVSMQKGKKYTQVAQRVEALRLHFPDFSLVTSLVENDGEVVIMKAVLSDGGRVLATGWAEEVRGSSHITKTSALEVCETSAIGRCLAAFGLHGGEYASASEVEQAVAEQAKPTITQEQCTKLLDLLRDGGLGPDDIEEYRKSLRIAAWKDLTVERFERLYSKMESKLAREYAEGEAASANGRDA